MHYTMNWMYLLLYFWRSLIRSHDMTDVNVLAGLPWWLPFRWQHPEQAPADRERCAASPLLCAREEAQASHRRQASTGLSSLHCMIQVPSFFGWSEWDLIYHWPLYVCSGSNWLWSYYRLAAWAAFCVSDVLFVRGGLKASDAIGWMDEVYRGNRLLAPGA